MFRRLIFDNWVMIFPLVSIIVATIVYATVTWGACRMKKPKIEHLENLPLADDNEERKVKIPGASSGAFDQTNPSSS